MAANKCRFMADRIERLLAEDDERPERERAQLVRLMCLFASLSPPPDPVGLFPKYLQLQEDFIEATEGEDAEQLEESFLALYAHIHGYEAPYTPSERRHVDAKGGYWCHAGGLSPILKAEPYIGRDTISGDFGAGNGLQGLLFQVLYPHRLAIQIEISSCMVEAGRHLQKWLGIPKERVRWVVGDVAEVSPAEMSFVYLYRPVRPTGPGVTFYRRFAEELEQADHPLVIFSIADCLKDFLSSDVSIFYNDGHLTCFKKG